MKEYWEMLSYIEICTLIYYVFLRLSKISQKSWLPDKRQQLYSVQISIYWYILSISAYIQVGLCIPHYILVWAHEYCCKTVEDSIYVYKHCVSGYKSVYKRINSYKTSCNILILCIFAYIRVYTLIYWLVPRYTVFIHVYTVLQKYSYAHTSI